MPTRSQLLYIDSAQFGLNDKNFKLIISALTSFPEIESATIFGSRAMGNYKTGSDIDIAITGNISQQKLARIKATLEEEIPTPYFFDVVVIDNLDNADLKEHIIKHGKQII